MIIGDNIAYSELLILGIAAYLFINSLVIGIKERNTYASLFFAASCISLSVILFFKVVYIEELVQEIASLLILPFFYLNLLFHRKDFKLNWGLVLHLLIPLSWVIVNQYEIVIEIEGVFDFIYLLATAAYGWVSIYEASKLKKVTYWNAKYLEVLFVGLIITVSLRFLLPIFFQSADDYTLYFHIALGVYFILLSSFYIRVPIKSLEEQMASIQIDDAINYEEEVKRKLKYAMQMEKAYLNPDLTLNDLAEKLGMKSTELSTFINNKVGKNFNDFVNEYRVEEVKQLMTSPTTDPQATIMELAYEAGFNSKASFNRIFKQMTQMTPTQFRKSVTTH